MPRLTVGLTGGIASGKSLVSMQFAALGVPVLDADQVARDVVAPPSPALAEIIRQFGAEFLDPAGRLDRRKMREHVFGNASSRRALEAILHPHIASRLAQWRDAQNAPYCILSVAILLETGMKTLVDRVLVIDTPVETQLRRLTQRDGISAELARSMIAAQIAREARLARADDVVNNAGESGNTQQQVAQMHEFYLRIAASGNLRAPGLRLN